MRHLASFLLIKHIQCFQKRLLIKTMIYFLLKIVILIIINLISILIKYLRKINFQIFFRKIILGLQHIDSKNIDHRDIKLENILIDLNIRVKIYNFGTGILLDSENELIYDQCRTPMYMAPEIILNSKIKGYGSPPVDIWSARITLYIMLSGTLPFSFKGGNNKEFIKNLMDKKNENKSTKSSISLNNSNSNNYELH